MPNYNDMKKAIDLIRDRRNHYLTAEAYYEGTQSEIFTNPSWYRLLSVNGNDFRFNFCRTVVDSVLNRLEVANITANTEIANQKIKDIWQMNDLQIDADEIHRRALVYGDAYSIVWTDINGNITVDYNSPLTTIMIYDDENPRIKKFAAKLWQTEDPNDYTKKIARLNMYYPDRIEKFEMSGEIENVVSVGGFRLIDVVENPWGEVPVFHFRTTKVLHSVMHFLVVVIQQSLRTLMKMVLKQKTLEPSKMVQENFGILKALQRLENFLQQTTRSLLSQFVTL